MSEGAPDSGNTRVQVAALCWRRRHAAEVLLVTSLRTRRWIIPKGWPQWGRKPWQTAAAEAVEEAGVVGEIGKTPIGHFHYLKEKGGTAHPCRVSVYSLRVTLEQDRWPHMHKRQRLWLPPELAAARIAEPELRHLILTHPGLGVPASRHPR
jgi:8-oxo-dGTP pyrophosphatase MutT (NUDIX family)